MKVKTYYNTLKQAFREKVERGFTLVEAMAGIFILSVVVGGPMIIAGRAAEDIRQSRQVFTATYLAQEAIELLRFKRDSIFLECSDIASVECPLITVPTNPGVTEFPNEAAWRIFKEQLTACFDTDGCTYDTVSMFSSPVDTPTDLYDPLDASCNTLYQDSSRAFVANYVPSPIDFMYFCSSHKPSNAVDTNIRRIVKITPSTNFISPSYDASYGDELRIDVTIYYKFNGKMKSILVTDYIKPRA